VASPDQAGAARWVYWAVGIAAVGGLLYALKGVLTPVLFAFGLAYLLDPLVDSLEAHRLNRTVAIVVIVALAMIGLGLFALLVVPAVVRDLGELARELPAAARRLFDVAEPWLRDRGIELPASSSEALERIQGDVSSLVPSAMGSIQAVLRLVLGGTASALGSIIGGIMVPIFTFYLLQDFDRIVAAIHEMVPPRLRDSVASSAREVDIVLGQFVRGQLIVMALLALMYAVGYSAVGVKLAIPIAIVAGMLAFIPYVGGGVALLLAVVMALLHWTGWGQLIAIVVVYAVIQVLEGFVITPRVVGDKLGLSPIWVLFALAAGGELFGFMGVMLALPLAAVVKVFVMRGLIQYRRSGVFTGEAVPE
jgi:predicted PurR-regulated permease PerM